MTSRIKIRVISLLIGLGLGAGTYHFVKQQQTPPLQKDFAAIELSFCRYYDQHGAMPADLAFLPEEQRQLIQSPQSGIHWGASAKELHYTYDKPYPVNPPDLLRFFTLKKQGGSFGKILNEDTVKNNTLIFKAAGKL